MNIVHVTREYRGLGEAGGVKDVVRDMTRILAASGENVSVFHPHYGFLRKMGIQGKLLWSQTMPGGWKAEVSSLYRDGVRILLVDTPWFQSGEGVYNVTPQEAAMGVGEAGQGYPSATERTLSFQAATLTFCRATGWAPDVLHAHDALTALVVAFVQAPVKILTIHNAGKDYQQNIASKEVLDRFFEIDDGAWSDHLLNDQWSPILFASQFSRLFTVSKFYAEEILSEDASGESGGLGPEIKRRGVELRGVFNGLDFEGRNVCDLDPSFSWTQTWYQETGTMGKMKRQAKDHFLKMVDAMTFVGGKPDPDKPWFLYQGRLTRQKGIDELLSLLEDTPKGGWYVVMGQGEAFYQKKLSDAALSGTSLTYFPTYEEKFLLGLFSASEFFLGPSVYEPCALTDLMAMRVGTIPLVRATGGLKKVRDGVEGFLYQEPGGLRNLVEKALQLWVEGRGEMELYARRAWTRTRDFEWEPILRKFWLPIYQGLDPSPEQC